MRDTNHRGGYMPSSLTLRPKSRCKIEVRSLWDTCSAQRGLDGVNNVVAPLSLVSLSLEMLRPWSSLSFWTICFNSKIKYLRKTNEWSWTSCLHENIAEHDDRSHSPLPLSHELWSMTYLEPGRITGCNNRSRGCPLEVNCKENTR